MQSKPLNSIDEVSNDSGVSSGTSRDSLNLDTSDYDARETNRAHVSLTSEDFEEDTVSDVFNTAFIAPEGSGTLASSILAPVESGPTTFEFVEDVCKKKKLLGKRKAVPWMDDTQRNDEEENEDGTGKMKRPKKLLPSSPVKSSSINSLEKKEIKNEVTYKLSSFDTPQLSSNRLQATYRKEVSTEVIKESVQECGVRSNTTRIVTEVECCSVIGDDKEFDKMSSNSSTTSDLRTSFEFDSSLVEKRKILGKRRIPLEDLNSESPKNKRRHEGGGLYGIFKCPTVPSMATCTSVELRDVLETEVKYTLPLVPTPQKQSMAFGSISGDTLVEVMKEHGDDFDKKYVLVDCRYPYEYEGGHIKGAVNFYDSEKVSDLFFPEDRSKAVDIKKKIPIFYCEFSQKRGPGMASSLRSMDRKRNVYPEISYKELYVLDRGYKKFFTEDKHHEYCEPSGYVSMLDKRFSDELKKYKHHHESEHRRIRRNLSRDKSSIVRSLEFKKRSFNFQSFD
uniref:M-phase inducer phosphatase n=1 Tax=Strongyloides papillosus TaxID=174720 RepID=A0A0N5C373_STREA